MNTKKSHAADLENKRFIFFELGCVITLAVVLLGFNLRTHEKKPGSLLSDRSVTVQEEMIAITQQEKLPPPPAPPAQTTVIEIVSNESEMESEEIEFNAEADQDTRIETYVPYTPPDMEEEEEAEEIVFVIVESMPSFPGGDEARIEYLRQNISYPIMAREAGIEGTVYLTFVVEKNGEITSVRVLRGIGGGCDEEAVRVVENMPLWIPGKQRNIPVRVQFNLPVKFILM